MTDCWLVVAGAYSDYRVLGVFATEGEANVAIAARIAQLTDDVTGAKLWRPDDLRTEVLPFGQMVGDAEGQYRAEITHEGQLVSCFWLEEVYEFGRPHVVLDVPTLIGDTQRHPLRFFGYGETREHAKRAALELYRAVKAGTLVLQRDPVLDWCLIPAASVDDALPPTTAIEATL